ncbi:MAG: hypothetical protein KAZ26_20055 [Caldilineaceae bacterium]|nr:hypothetical protein [Caldilineaceae bacterium]
MMIANGEIPAVIDCTAIYAHGGVLYQVVWWAGGTRYSEWMAEHELTPSKPKVAVGFRREAQP